VESKEKGVKSICLTSELCCTCPILCKGSQDEGTAATGEASTPGQGAERPERTLS